MTKFFAFTLSLIFFVSINVFRVDGIYFHIRETESKCFIEEVPEDTMIVGQLNVFLGTLY